MEYAFHLYNQHARDGIQIGVDTLLKNNLASRLTPNRFLTKMEGAGMRSRTENREFQQNFNGDFSPMPVLLCVGSDLTIGDSLGPIVGSMLKYKTQGLRVFIYGTLSMPVTAKEIPYMRTFLKETHPQSQVLAIDAAVGESGDIGLLKCLSSPLFPGAGANKKLGAIGDVSIIGIVAEKSLHNFALLNTTRLNLVYSMAEIISDSIANVLWNRQKTARKNLS